MRRRRRGYVSFVCYIAALALLIAGDLAGQAAQAAPTPCATSPDRHRFDFWIGEWRVTNTAGVEVGKSSVQSISGGCALLENWTSARGGQGKSINAFNVATGEWQQYWIGQDGNVTEYRESEWHGAAITFIARGKSTLQRLTFTPQADGAVRQLGESSTDGGKTWTVNYDFRYRRG